MSEARQDRLVAVTGASGYVGSHIVRQLLERGDRVRGTVRDPNDETKTTHLKALPGAERLELVAADLQDGASFDEALSGCDGLIHTASSVRLGAKDPQKEIIEPAVQGTRNVLNAAVKAGITNIVVTSSIAAVSPAGAPSGTTFTEQDWNETADPRKAPYPFSKVQAERAAWSLVDSLPEAERPRLVTILPGFVLGPVLTKVHVRSSPATVRQLMRGKMPMIPRFSLAVVDVRDVAKAHLDALESETARGRYIVVAGGMWLQEVVEALRPEFPGHKLPRRQMPDALMYVTALFSKQLSIDFLRQNLGRVRLFDSRRAREELGFEARPVRDTVIDTGRSMVELGLV